VLDSVRTANANEDVRHVKGSHIVVPRVHPEEHAYILQNADQRIVFVIPYHRDYSLIGTTDIPVETYERPAISDAETDNLLQLANEYLDRPLSRTDIVWTYSGVRPRYDDGS
jgi:glycerol-3-phosphate dehydrogenase